MIVLQAATATPPARAQTKPVVWNLPHVAAPSYYLIQNLNAFAAKVKERSGGRMEIRVHPASSLYPGPEIIPALVEGRAEIGMVLTGYLTDILLELGVLELPFMTGSIDEHRRAAQQLAPFYTERLAGKGLKPLATYPWPSQQLFSSRPIKTVQDFKGTKIRVYGAETAELFRSLGSAPVSIPFGEVYVALQRNVVDGAITSATNAEPMKFFEVSKFLNYWFFNAPGSSGSR
jgi:TRAP-type C4-dicarboxylate transport system substrate-binding protein